MTEAEYREILAYRKRAYKFEPHKFTHRLLHYVYCDGCGLLAMRNDFSQWAQKVGCNWDVHPSLKLMRKKYSPLR